MTAKSEQETIVRWDREDPLASLYTAHPGQAARWQRLGYDVAVTDRDTEGQPRSWTAYASVGAIRFRKVRDGAIIKRKGGIGRQFRAIDGAAEAPTALSTG